MAIASSRLGICGILVATERPTHLLLAKLLWNRSTRLKKLSTKNRNNGKRFNDLESRQKPVNSVRIHALLFKIYCVNIFLRFPLTKNLTLHIYVALTKIVSWPIVEISFSNYFLNSKKEIQRMENAPRIRFQ